MTGKLDAATHRARQALCRMGHYCSEHNFVHGAEAEELREKLEKLLVEEVSRETRMVPAYLLQHLLDDVDARDSLAYLEGRPKLAKQSPTRKPRARKK